jgi:hypothetical protein
MTEVLRRIFCVHTSAPFDTTGSLRPPARRGSQCKIRKDGGSAGYPINMPTLRQLPPMVA